MVSFLFSVLPPTPTAPPVAPPAPLDIPSFGLWDPAKHFIGMWNQHLSVAQGFQIAIIVALIVASIFVVWFLIRGLFVGGNNDQ